MNAITRKLVPIAPVLRLARRLNSSPASARTRSLSHEASWVTGVANLYFRTVVDRLCRLIIWREVALLRAMGRLGIYGRRTTMGVLDAFVSGAFRDEAAGRVVVFSGGRRNRGYVVRSE